jgi:hypothetical protein
MKYFLLFILTSSLCFSCKNSTPDTDPIPTDTGGSQDDPDLVAINDAVHDFYKWYDANMEELSNIQIVKGSGNATTLVSEQLDTYHAMLLKSGFISQEYVNEDKSYLKNLEATAWKNENVEEGPLTGLDYDRFLCAQDWDINFWTTAPVGAEGLGTDRVKATLSGTEGGSPREQMIELKKENGKWLIAKIDCETGVD